MFTPEKPEIIAVGPAGAWGSAFAKVVADEGYSVRIFIRDPKDLLVFQETRRTKHLPGIVMPDNMKATSDRKEFVANAGLIVLAPPSEKFRSFYREIRSFFASPRPYVLSLTKGLEKGTNLRMSEIILEEDPTLIDNIAVLSGPNLADEIARSAFASTTVAAYNLGTAELIQSWLISEHFRIYASEDPAGVEYGGALKNIMALGAGIAYVLGLPPTSQASYFTRALEEMVRFGTALGACEETFRGSSGVGDLALSCCYGAATRNFRAGLKIVQGQSVEEIQAAELVEGLSAIQSAVVLAQMHNIDTPIISALNRVIYGGLDIREGINQLMGRQPTREQLRGKGLIHSGARLAMRALHNLGIRPPRNFPFLS